MVPHEIRNEMEIGGRVYFGNDEGIEERDFQL